MSGLKDHLIKRIDAEGPMTLADYMATVLMHPTLGYYQREIVFGAEGDFITAPEVSQMFGEMIGLWLADRWIKMGRPAAVNLVELGPGRGTLMADILRATEPVEEFQSAVTVHFVETAKQLRAEQQSRVPDAHWHDTFASVPDGPSLIVANEFFDALPIHQFEKLDGIWHERMVSHVRGKLGLSLGPCGSKFALVDPAHHALNNGSILEVCPAALSITGDIADHLNRNGGAALIIDYGYRKSGAGDTFQALKNHAYADPFQEPGTADLTAHVAFDQLKKATEEKGAKTYGPANQGMFLMAVGMGARAQALAAGADDATQTRILEELKRLTAPDEMGNLFKVLALQPHDLAPPPGF